ncbi:alpha-aminoadipic semialdehyde synthase, mitochondrial-like [Cherax quadricarinatus]|uniref:alpha-aminoadipic semialdehyde synthase, mitochondrial-like n=1 Tax=Cherax quadricarinatus TaxID=27406 RepID=UPI00387E5C06
MPSSSCSLYTLSGSLPIFKGPGVLVCSIDNMPIQLPKEATDLFGSLLLPHMYNILKSDASKPFEEQSFTHEVHGVW